jgi:hypothetical protein
MKKSTIKTFKRFIKEEKETYYTLDLYKSMSKEEIVFYSNQLLQLTLKMLKNTDVIVTVEPVLDSEEN